MADAASKTLSYFSTAPAGVEELANTGELLRFWLIASVVAVPLGPIATCGGRAFMYATIFSKPFPINPYVALAVIVGSALFFLSLLLFFFMPVIWVFLCGHALRRVNKGNIAGAVYARRCFRVAEFLALPPAFFLVIALSIALGEGQFGSAVLALAALIVWLGIESTFTQTRRELAIVTGIAPPSDAPRSFLIARIYGRN
jgi:hypothetical protein